RPTARKVDSGPMLVPGDLVSRVSETRRNSLHRRALWSISHSARIGGPTRRHTAIHCFGLASEYLNLFDDPPQGARQFKLGLLARWREVGARNCLRFLTRARQDRSFPYSR
ncbi:MAG: hypothetical protein ACYSUI_19570, partial [Planctomycetota bacterium]